MLTRRLISRLVAEISVIEKYTARYGREAGHKMFRTVNGHVVTSVQLERAEIDHTIMDLFVVDGRARTASGLAISKRLHRRL
jgi:putative transposase